jgi:ankyrin repeat protein
LRRGPTSIQSIIIVELLLERGANTNAKDENGSTALHEAALSGHVAVVLLLLEKGADIDTRNGRGETALHEAAWKEREAVIRLLLTLFTSRPD